jgi:hypothetical protein
VNCQVLIQQLHGSAPVVVTAVPLLGYELAIQRVAKPQPTAILAVDD